MTSFLDYAERGRTDWWRYPVATVLALAIMIALGVGLTFALKALGWLPADFADQMQHVRDPTIFFVATGLVFGAMLAGFAAAIALVHRKRFTDLLGAWRWRGFAAGFGIWLAIGVVLTLADLALAPSGFSFTASRQTPALALWALLGLGVQTFTEEFVFRGYVTQGLLLATREPSIAALVSGLLFGLLHIANGVPQMINALIFGVVLAMIAIRTGGLAFTSGLHIANNLFGAVVVVSGGDVFKGAPGLFTQNTPQLVWWDLVLAILATFAVGAFVLLRAPPPEADDDPEDATAA